MRQAVLAILVAAVSATIGYCNDRDRSCSTWGVDGECTGANAEHVRTICPHTCGACTHVCSYLDTSCPQWAQAGECKSSAEYMLTNCPTSCGLCAPKCADVHVDCNHWQKEGACESNPGFMCATPATARPVAHLTTTHAPQEPALSNCVRRVPWRVQGSSQRLSRLGEEGRVRHQPRVHA